MSRAVSAELRRLGRGEGVVSVTPLEGGCVAEVAFVDYTDGSRVVAKLLHDAPDDFHDAEVDGLAALAETGTVQVPRVLGSTDRMLLLEPLPARVDEDA
jgi:fructosamine-3-kinase